MDFLRNEGLRHRPLAPPAGDSCFPPSASSLVGAVNAIVLTVPKPCSSRRRPRGHEAASTQVSFFTRSSAAHSVGTPPRKQLSSSSNIFSLHHVKQVILDSHSPYSFIIKSTKLASFIYASQVWIIFSFVSLLPSCRQCTLSVW